MRIPSIVVGSFSVILSGMYAAAARAQSYGLEETGAKLGYDQSQTVYSIIGTVTSGVLASIAFIFFGLALYAGLRWLTANGNQEKIEKAQSTLTAAIVGLIITLSSYGLTVFIFQRLGARDSGANSAANGSSGTGSSAGASGACANGKQDGTETDVDCGGSCDACRSVGQKCVLDKDCALGPCVNLACTSSGPSCTDGIKNRDESAADCGGEYCQACGAGLACNSASDCVQGQTCTMNMGKGYKTCGGF